MSWPDWLGYGEGKPKQARGTFLPFMEAREVARAQQLCSPTTLQPAYGRIVRRRPTRFGIEGRYWVWATTVQSS